jgi:Acetyltransferase (GNAT) domain
MSIEIVQADLARDGVQIAKALSDYLNPRADRTRFEWLYANNPNGKAKVWVAWDNGNKLVATAAAFPRRVYVGGEKYTAWVLGDFCVADSYRSLGPALDLQKKCLADLKNSDAAFCYDFPSRSMLAVYRRLGLTPSTEMIRFAKALKLNTKLAKVIKSRILVRAVSAPLNKLLAVYGRTKLSNQGVRFSVYEGSFGREFSRLAESLGSSLGICIDRSCDYLNWRYRLNPLYSYEVVTARRANHLVGYCVFYQGGQNGTIVDLFGDRDGAVIAGLIGTVENLLEGRGAEVLSIPVADRNPFVPLLRGIGFAQREKAPVIRIFSHASSDYRHAGNSDWLLMVGDRDS